MYKNKARRDFLLTLFNSKEEYQVKELNGFVLVKRWDGTKKYWEVVVFTKESFNHQQGLLDK